MKGLAASVLQAQRVVGAAVFGVATLLLALGMARAGHTPWGVGLGLGLDLLAALGALGMLGMLREPGPAASALAPGAPPESGAAPYRDPPQPTAAPAPPPVLTPAMILVAVGAAVLLPDLGFGLWDPWETHYGEVAREILSRDDWISLWWQDEWFWSKPILLFWMSAVSMGLLGVRAGPDGGAAGHHAGGLWPVSIVLAVVGVALVARAVRAGRAHGVRAALVRALPLVTLVLVLRELWVCHARGTTLELALRLPVVLWALGALGAIGWAVDRLFGARAALWSGLVLLTTPYWFFLAHQSMVDMPFVAALTIAMCMLLVAWKSGSDEVAPGRTIVLGGCRIELHAMHAVAATIVLLVLPQVVYLLTRHVTIGDPILSLHADRFSAGSAGNGPLRPGMPHLRFFPPLVQGLIALAPAAAVLYFLRSERRLRPTLMLAFYVLAALSLMGKGLPGVGLPGLVALVALAVTGRWALLKELRLLSGVGIVYAVGLPWFVAMFSRHGPRFTDRLLIHDHINRLTVGVHGDTGSLQYFLGQLGYGMFPWAGLVVVGAAALFLRPAAEEREGGEHGQVLLWFVLSFALFSMMVTKFHHYVFPAVPPLAMLVGIGLDRITPRDDPAAPPSPAQRLAMFAAICVAVLVPTWMMATEADARWDVARTLPILDLLGPGGAALVVLLALVLFVGVRARLAPPSAEDPGVRAGIAATLVGGAALLALVTRDLADATSSARPKGTERLIHLFIYNYQRSWPQGFDASDALVAFGSVATVLLLVAASARLRRMAVTGLFVLSLAFSLWAIHGHMNPLSQHWSQHHLIRTYYARRASADERLVAWQMNWKGENLYTGNRVIVYVSLDNTEVERWIERHRGETHWFLLEKGRLGNLRRLLDCDERTCPVADDSSNKFALLRARL